MYLSKRHILLTNKDFPLDRLCDKMYKVYSRLLQDWSDLDA